MQRLLWWLPLALFIVFSAGLGLRYGWLAMTTTEAEVISRYAEKYLDDRLNDGTIEGASLLDCVAYPGRESGIWLYISCGPTPFDSSRHYKYEVNRIGQFIRGWSPSSAGIKPRTRGAPET